MTENININNGNDDDINEWDYYFDYDECPDSEVYPCKKERRTSKTSNNNLRHRGHDS